jgi:CSLREA domain-containing protein
MCRGGNLIAGIAQSASKESGAVRTVRRSYTMRTLPLPKILLGALLLSGATGVHAATLLVTTTTDTYDGQCNQHCSLRDAVAVANQSADADIILLPSATYTLTRLNLRSDNNVPVDEDDNLIGDLDVAGELLIKGAGIGKSIIKGATSDLFATEHRLIEVQPDAHLILKHLTLTEGRSAYNGGAVENHGRLLLHDVQAMNSIARHNDESTSGGNGGGIANYGELLVLASQFDNNSAIREEPGPLGGAIFNSGSLWVRGSHFNRNSSFGFSLTGAGAAIYSSGNAKLEGSSFIGNSSSENVEGGAITNDEGGVLLLSNSTLSGNFQGALSNGRTDTSSKVTLTNVTVANNLTDTSGPYAVMNWGQLRIRNSLIAGNHDIHIDDLTNCRNFGDHYSYQAIGLLRNDESSNCDADLFVPLEQTFTQVLSPTLSSDGKTSFHALLSASSAVDAGVGSCVSKDQRGVFRPKDGNGDGVAVCDLGAYELTP